MALSLLEFVSGQEVKNKANEKPNFIGLSFDYGFLIKHTPSLRQIDDAYPSAISLDWSQLLLIQSVCEFCNCFPRIGVDMALWNWDNREVLGHGILAMGYLEPYFNTHSRTNLFFRLGIGGAYLTQPYDEVTNVLNESYSTHLSFALMVGFGVNYRVTDT